MTGQWIASWIARHQVGDAHGRLGARRVAHHHHTAAACQAAPPPSPSGAPERINDDVDAARSEPGKPVGEALALPGGSALRRD
jgi:hypothetical protein